MFMDIAVPLLYKAVEAVQDRTLVLGTTYWKLE